MSLKDNCEPGCSAEKKLKRKCTNESIGKAIESGSMPVKEPNFHVKSQNDSHKRSRLNANFWAKKEVSSEPHDILTGFLTISELTLGRL